MARRQQERSLDMENTVQFTQLWELSSDLPIVVTIIDREAAIADFVPLVKVMVKDGLVTLLNFRLELIYPIDH
ncbi:MULTISPECIES: DUF190 domain-containing protein [unclassified Nostoc]|uniref:DUF190 domain-containing protein n=1 Tax=unclassified Nostoc TaxID=2593658 RepID=UPI001F54AB8B|nr:MULTISPECIES: DUF190 domain-containing protein [unclassified Nostoc]